MSSIPVPKPLPLHQALADHAPFARLVQRVRESQARLTAVTALLPPPMRPALQAGPLDDEAWTLLVANAAVAAKLRHLAPLLKTRLAEAGFRSVEIRIKVQQATSSP